MNIGLVVLPWNETNLRLASQIGVADIVYYDMRGMPSTYDEWMPLRKNVEHHGMRLRVAEGGPPSGDIVLAGPQREKQMEHYKRCLEAMGKAGIGVLCYNFMPPSVCVARTSYETRERGGALTSSFHMQDWDDTPVPEAPTHDAQVWDNLEYFLNAVIPAAEAAEVKLAMHPDDPPLSPLRGMARIMRSVENFQRLIELHPSPSNGLTFCQGCFSEMCADVPSAIRQFGDRIHFAHFRDVSGDTENFHETFHDNGKTDMAAAIDAYRDINYKGVIRPDHVPLLAGEPVPASGYTMLGRLYAVGYMRGLMERNSGA